MDKSLLKVKNLTVHFSQQKELLQAVRGISFDMHKGEVLCLVGESGCGKSLTALSILNLVGFPGQSKGEVIFEDKDLLQADEKYLSKVRGGRIGLVFQEPMAALNPVFTIGDQILESLLLHRSFSKKQAHSEMRRLLESVGIGDVQRRLSSYPHELSGGMLQRIMIAIALAGEPDILIADEPTTALDVTIQTQILSLLKTIVREKNVGLLLITHDFGVVAEMAHRVAVMYAGEIVEIGPVRQIFDTPRHPYTKGLFDALPHTMRQKKLVHIPGSVPDLSNMPEGCAFHPRCPRKQVKCTDFSPALEQVDYSRTMNNVLNKNISKSLSKTNAEEKNYKELEKRNGHEIACFNPYMDY